MERLDEIKDEFSELVRERRLFFQMWQQRLVSTDKYLDENGRILKRYIELITEFHDKIIIEKARRPGKKPEL